jgi:hypothetical protein
MLVTSRNYFNIEHGLKAIATLTSFSCSCAMCIGTPSRHLHITWQSLIASLHMVSAALRGGTIDVISFQLDPL